MGYVGQFSWGRLGATCEVGSVVVVVDRWVVDALGGLRGGDCVRSTCSFGLDELGVNGAACVSLGLLPEWLWFVVGLSLWLSV